MDDIESTLSETFESIDVDDERDVLGDIIGSVSEQPQNVSTLMDELDADLSRDQVEYRAETMADSGLFNQRKLGDGRTATTVYWADNVSTTTTDKTDGWELEE